MVSLESPRERKSLEIGCKNIKFLNAKGEPPLLLTRYKTASKNNSIIYTFYINYINLTLWADAWESLNTTLNNRKIVSINPGEKNTLVSLVTIPYNEEPYPKITWDDSFLSNKESVFVLGETHLGNLVTIDISKEVHVLIGGSTGSGKSILLKGLLYQALMQNMTVYIVDMKGGLDYPSFWHKHCTFTYNAKDALVLLENIRRIYEERTNILRESECPNIDIYNTRVTNPTDKLPHIIIACDEVAQLLDKSSSSKEEKELAISIEHHITFFAQTSRAHGIHLICATQRPSVDVISGSIKNNMDCRICGKADHVLSKIVLDNIDASLKIPKDSQGVFVTNKGDIFKAYMLDTDTY